MKFETILNAYIGAIDFVGKHEHGNEFVSSDRAYRAHRQMRKFRAALLERHYALLHLLEYAYNRIYDHHDVFAARPLQWGQDCPVCKVNKSGMQEIKAALGR